MSKEITIIDYGMGNLRSVQKKIIRCGADAVITSDPEQIAKAEKLVLPGVGHFANGMQKLTDKGILQALNETVLQRKIPVLGICLGMQLMAKNSEEGSVDGLGWFDAEVVKFNIKDFIRYKVPHMGWNNIIPQKKHIILDKTKQDDMFYFVHSYHVRCNDSKDILTNTSYEYEFVSAISKDNIFGMQFHPEKSHDAGEQLFRNFIKL